MCCVKYSLSLGAMCRVRTGSSRHRQKINLQQPKRCPLRPHICTLQVESDTLCINGLNHCLIFHPVLHNCFSSHGIVVVSHRPFKQWKGRMHMCVSASASVTRLLYMTPFENMVCRQHLCLRWRFGQNAKKINVAVQLDTGNQLLPHG